jgi:hypothetical protein
MTAAGYSGTPLPAKLGLKTGMRFLALDAPANLDALLADAPKLKRLPPNSISRSSSRRPNARRSPHSKSSRRR